MYFRSLILLARPCIVITSPERDLAWAHAYPVAFRRRDGSTIAQAPREIRIRFTEGVELEFSRIDVKNAGGEKLVQGTLRKIANDTWPSTLSRWLPEATS